MFELDFVKDCFKVGLLVVLTAVLLWKYAVKVTKMEVYKRKQK